MSEKAGRRDQRKRSLATPRTAELQGLFAALFGHQPKPATGLLAKEPVMPRKTHL
jgi:hypothetical protein